MSCWLISCHSSRTGQTFNTLLPRVLDAFRVFRRGEKYVAAQLNLKPWKHKIVISILRRARQEQNSADNPRVTQTILTSRCMQTTSKSKAWPSKGCSIAPWLHVIFQEFRQHYLWTLSGRHCESQGLATVFFYLTDVEEGKLSLLKLLEHELEPRWL